MSKTKFRDTDCRHVPFANLRTGSDRDTTGYVETEHGIVVVYADTWNDDTSATRLEMVISGRSYDRTWERRFTDKGISRLANKFARDVVARLEEA